VGGSGSQIQVSFRCICRAYGAHHKAINVWKEGGKIKVLTDFNSAKFKEIWMCTFWDGWMKWKIWISTVIKEFLHFLKVKLENYVYCFNPAFNSSSSRNLNVLFTYLWIIVTLNGIYHVYHYSVKLAIIWDSINFSVQSKLAAIYIRSRGQGLRKRIRPRSGGKWKIPTTASCTCTCKLINFIDVSILGCPPPS